MVTDGVVRSTCGLCYGGCGVLVHLKDGRVVKIEGDPNSPINKGRLCAKGLASLEYLYHPQRLKYPLRRVVRKGNAGKKVKNYSMSRYPFSRAMASMKNTDLYIITLEYSVICAMNADLA